MTPRERVLTAIARREPDRVPTPCALTSPSPTIHAGAVGFAIEALDEYGYY